LPSESGIPSFTKALHKLIQAFEKEKIDYMLIGGFALPAYGLVRATQDIDIAIAVKSIESSERLFKTFKERSIEPTSKPILGAACIYFLDSENMVDIGIWQKPNGIIFDDELLKRRKYIELEENLSIWIVSAEDFIINKLARTDRRAQDESDVISVLARQKRKLDRKYLKERAERAGVLALLETLELKVLGQMST